MRISSSIVGRRVLTNSFCVLALVAGGRLCSASVIYSDLSGSDGGQYIIGTNSPGGYDNFQQAVEIIPSVDVLAGTVDIDASSYQTSNEVTVEIAADNSGLPGTILASQTETGVIPTFGGITGIAFSSPVTLSANTPYWVIFSGPNLGNEEYTIASETTQSSSNGTTGALDQANPGWTELLNGNDLPGFELTTDTAAPEPGTLLSASLALLFLMGLVSLRKRTQHS